MRRAVAATAAMAGVLFVVSVAVAGGPYIPQPENLNVNAANQQQQQQQGQQQGNNQGVTVNNGGSEFPHQAPALLAPGLVTAPETCAGSTSVGASTWWGGLLFGTTWTMNGCELRMFAMRLQMLGLREAAVHVLAAANPIVKQALLDTGYKLAATSDPSDRPHASQHAVRAADPVVSSQPSYGATVLALSSSSSPDRASQGNQGP